MLIQKEQINNSKLHYNMRCIVSRERGSSLGIIRKDNISYRRVKFEFNEPKGLKERVTKICPSCGREIAFDISSQGKLDRDKKIGLGILHTE